MELLVLGSGTAVPHPQRRPSGLLIRTEGRDILIDAGPGILHRLSRVGTAFQHLQDVFLTHLHPDHFLDLLALLFAKRYPRADNAPRLTVRGGAGLKALMDRLRETLHPWLEPSGYELIVEEWGGPVYVEGLKVLAEPVPHHPSSLAFRFQELDGGASLVVSGDTEGGEGLIRLAQGAQLLVLECSFPDGEAQPGHLTPSRAGRLAREAGVQRLLLTHFYPECDGREILGPAAEAFGGEVLLAYDWMRLKVGSGHGYPRGPVEKASGPFTGTSLSGAPL